jgi:hypothetical protein
VAGKEKVIAVVGVSEEDTAHLRLLLRKVADHLKYQWRWGAEDGADLVLIDPKTFAGQLARNRFGATGARWALLLDAGQTEASADYLQRPLKAQAFHALLRQIEGTVLDGLDLVPIGDDFFFQDGMGQFRSEHSLDELENFDSGSDEPARIMNLRGGGDAEESASELPMSTTVPTGVPSAAPAPKEKNGFGEAPSARTERRRGEEEGLRLELDVPTAARRAQEEAQRSEPLEVYLNQPLLGGPARVHFDSAPALVLDPKNRQFHADSGLKALAPYCRASIVRSAFSPITGAELAQLQDSEPARSYDQLLWLNSILHSDGRLSSTLDPGGTFHLTRSFDLGRDYPSAQRIAQAMVHPRRLHEIAAVAQADMVEVFAVVNAYHLIGYVAWTPRQPRKDRSDRRGLLGLIRLPFGRK